MTYLDTSSPEATAQIWAAIRRLELRVASYGAPGAVVAFSGGVDSSVVLAIAARTLTPAAVKAVTAVSASYPAGEIDGARATARSLSVAHEIVHTGEVEQEKYARNSITRCYHCKKELYGQLRQIMEAQSTPDFVLLCGNNADDASDFRPGMLAAAKVKVRSPLLDEGIGKSAVRRVAELLRLHVADKPSLSCLASRVKYGVRITPAALSRIDAAEDMIRSLGFTSVRVRHMGSEAQVEVPPSETPTLFNHPRLSATLEAIRGLGWSHVAVNRGGLQSGSMNGSIELPGPILRAMARLKRPAALPPTQHG